MRAREPITKLVAIPVLALAELGSRPTDNCRTRMSGNPTIPGCRGRESGCRRWTWAGTVSWTRGRRGRRGWRGWRGDDCYGLRSCRGRDSAGLSRSNISHIIILQWCERGGGTNWKWGNNNDKGVWQYSDIKNFRLRPLRLVSNEQICDITEPICIYPYLFWLRFIPNVLMVIIWYSAVISFV